MAGRGLVRRDYRTRALSLEALRTSGGVLRGTPEGVAPVLERWWFGLMAVTVIGLGMGWPLVSWVAPAAQQGSGGEVWWLCWLALLYLGVAVAPQWSVPMGAREQTLRWFVGRPFGRRALRGIPRLVVLATAGLGAVGTAVLALLDHGVSWDVVPAVVLGGGLASLAAAAWLGLMGGAAGWIRAMCALGAAALAWVAASGAAAGLSFAAADSALSLGTWAVACLGTVLVVLSTLLVPFLVDAADLRLVRQMVALRSAGMDAFEGMRLVALVPSVAPQRRAARNTRWGLAAARSVARARLRAWWLLAVRTWTRTLPGALLVIVALTCIAWWPTPLVTSAGSLAVAVGWGPWLLPARRAAQGPRRTFSGQGRESATWQGIALAWAWLLCLALIALAAAWLVLPAVANAEWLGAVSASAGTRSPAPTLGGQAGAHVAGAVVVAGLSRSWMMVPVQPPLWSGTPVPTPFGDVSVLRPLAWMGRGLFPSLCLAVVGAPWWPPLVALGCAAWLVPRTRQLMRELD